MNKKKQLHSSVEEEETKKPKTNSKEEEEEEVEGVEAQKRDKKAKGKKQTEGIDSGKEFDTPIFRLLKSQHPNIGITQHYKLWRCVGPMKRKNSSRNNKNFNNSSNKVILVRNEPNQNSKL